jgi:hypothetical protein
MSTKYKAKFTDTRENYEWELHLFDTSYTSYSDRVLADGGTVEGIDCLPLDLTELVEYKRMELGADAFELEYGKRGDEWYEPIKGSRVVFDFICSSQEDLDYVDEIAQVQETRFFVRLYRDGSIFWQGPILQDLLRLPYSTLPASVEIQATDGLARLKGVRKAISEFNNVAESIISILKDADIGNLWATGDDFLRTAVKWTEEQTYSGTPANTYDTLEFMFVPALGVQYTEDENGDPVYKSYYDYLEVVLKVLNCRILLADGLWNIEQIDQIEEGTTIYSNTYKKSYAIGANANPSTATGVTSRGSAYFPYFALSATADINRVGTDSSWTYIPAARTFEIRYKTDANIAINVEWMRVVSTTYTMRDLLEDANSGVRFRTEVGFHRVVNGAIIAQTERLAITATIKLVGSTTYYLAAGSNPGDGVWTTSAATLNLGSFVVSVPASSSLDVEPPTPYKVKYFQTPDVPIDGTIEISYTAELRTVPNTPGGTMTLGTINTGQNVSERGVKVGLGSTAPQGPSLTGRKYTVTNSVEANATFENDFGEVYLGDAINSANTANKIQAYDPTAPAVPTGKFVDSVSWTRFGVGTPQPLLALLLTKAMQLFELPRRLFDINYYGDINPIRAFRLGSRDYLWNWLKLNARASYVQSEAYELKVESTAQTVNDDNIYEDRNGIYSTPSVSDYLPPGSVDDGLSNPINGRIGSEVAGTTTSIPLSYALSYTLGFAGDSISVQRSDGSVETFILSEDAVVGATALSVESKSVTSAISTGSRVLPGYVNSAIQAQALTKFTISSIPDAELILQDSGVVTTSGLITTWKDSSGNANNFTGVDVTPVYKGGFRARLDGASSYLSNGTININQPFTLVFLINLKETNTGRYLFKATIGDFSIYTATAPDLTISTGSGPTNATIELPRSVWSVLQIRVNGASSEYRVDYDSWTAITLDGTALIEAPVIGYDGSSNFCQMELAALGIFAIELSDEQANALVNNLKSRIS